MTRISAFTSVRSSRSEVLLKLVMFVLSVAWCFAFLLRLDDGMFRKFEDAIAQLAQEVDRRHWNSAEHFPNLSIRDEGNVDWIQTRQGIRPSLSLDLPGMIVIFKPTDWEVDGLVVEGADHPPLSAYIQSVFPQKSFPLVYDAEHNYGFLHRLDIPSSGLVLGGTSYEGYYLLRLQLDTQRLRREYIVACHGLPLSSLDDIVARVDVAPDPSQRKSINDSGKPSQTFVCVEGHLVGRSELEEGQASLVAIRIFTGRRHQIRVHVRFSGIPCIADARYTARDVLIGGDLIDAGQGSGSGIPVPVRRPLKMRTYH